MITKKNLFVSSSARSFASDNKLLLPLCMKLTKDTSKKVVHRFASNKGEGKYSSYSFLTSARDGSEWSASLPVRVLPSGIDLWHPLDRRLVGGPQSWSGHRG
jgi:hypothetical protein